jgi:Holliday junction DNA helicase RuvA
MPVARLRGVVEDKGADWLIVAAGSLGLAVSVPASTADDLETGARVALYTHLHVREDALTLFGFRSADDLRLFEQLISVSGVGPRVALGLLSAMPTGELAASIVAGRADALRKVPGVGQKTAERIVLDLRDKVTAPASADSAFEQPRRPADADLIAALTALGYSRTEATDAASRLPENGDRPLEDRIRDALALFSGA